MFGVYRYGAKNISELIYDSCEFKLLDSISSFQFLMFDQFFSYNFIEFGLTLVLFSLFVKLALAPFHLWGRLKILVFFFLENLYFRDTSIKNFWKSLSACYMYGYINLLTNKYGIMKPCYSKKIVSKFFLIRSI